MGSDRQLTKGAKRIRAAVKNYFYKKYGHMVEATQAQNQIVVDDEDIQHKMNMIEEEAESEGEELVGRFLLSNNSLDEKTEE